MKLKNDKINIDVELDEEFTQGQFEKYQTALIEQADTIKANSVIERAIIQAALDSGILKGVSGKIEDMKPRAVRWLTIKVRDFINEQTEVPQD